MTLTSLSLRFRRLFQSSFKNIFPERLRNIFLRKPIDFSMMKLEVLKHLTRFWVLDYKSTLSLQNSLYKLLIFWKIQYNTTISAMDQSECSISSEPDTSNLQINVHARLQILDLISLHLEPLYCKSVCQMGNITVIFSTKAPWCKSGLSKNTCTLKDNTYTLWRQRGAFSHLYVLFMGSRFRNSHMSAVQE